MLFLVSVDISHKRAYKLNQSVNTCVHDRTSGFVIYQIMTAVGMVNIPALA